jgi:CDP-glucose 4,6-dehydratase
MTKLLEALQIPYVGLSLAPENESLFSKFKMREQSVSTYTDVRDYVQLKSSISRHRPSIVLHLAAMPLVRESYKYPRATIDTNVLGTSNILEICREYNSVVVGIVTTDKVYKNSNEGRRFIETDPLGGDDPYSISKVGTEVVVDFYREIYVVEGCRMPFSLRSGNVVGGGDFARERLLPDIVRKIFQNEKLVVRNLNASRPWQHVLDTLFGYLLAIEHSLGGGTERSWNFSPNELSLTVSDVLHIASQSVDKDFHVDASADKSRKAEAVTLNLDSRKAREFLGWKNVYSQSDAINSALVWWEKYFAEDKSADYLCDAEIYQYLNSKISS